MNKGTVVTAIFICGIFALTGCAAKKEFTSAGIAPSTASTAAETADKAANPSPDSTGKGVSGTTMSSIAAEDAAKAAATTGHSEVSQAKEKLQTVYFDFDAYLLSTAARDTLTRNASVLSDDKLVRIIIEGHADERGSDDYNLALAEKRALSAKRYLESLGIDAKRMEIISYGEDKPAVAGNDEAAWSRNRRVDFVGAN